MVWPSYNKQQQKIVTKILSSGKVNYWTGRECKNFEIDFSNYHKRKYSVSVSNGSVALEIALKSLSLKAGDQVVVTPRSFIISASCVLNLGLKPVFADVDKNGNLSKETISQVYNKKVKAVIIVHTNGLSCDIDPILKLKRKKNFYLIEDCSQAHGAKYRGNPVGSFGDIAIWSFCQDKIISTGGEGGMISTNSKKIWSKCWSIKDHGKNYNLVFKKKHKVGFKWLHSEFGSNYRMTELQAALGRYQLKKLDQTVKKRNMIANEYFKGLRQFYINNNLILTPNFKCSKCRSKKSNIFCELCTHAFYRLNFFLNKKKFTKKFNLSKLIEELNKKGIHCGVGNCPEIYKEKIFQKIKYFNKKEFKNAKYLGEISLVFSIDPTIEKNKLKKKIFKIAKVLKKYDIQ